MRQKKNSITLSWNKSQNFAICTNVIFGPTLVWGTTSLAFDLDCEKERDTQSLYWFS